MVLTGNKANNKAKRLASINHTTRKCHHHYNFRCSKISLENKTVIKLLRIIKWIRIYLKRLTCVANFALKRARTDKKDITHPSVVASIDQDFYVGNFLKSNNSVEHLTKFTKIAFSILK